MKIQSFHPTQSTLALSIKAIATLGVTTAIYFQDLTIIANDALQSEFMSHILAIPFLFSYLLYRKRKMIRAAIPFQATNQPRQTKHLPTLSGILLCTTAVILYWHGSYTFIPLEYHILTLPIFTAGLTLIMFNPQTLRQLAFPIAFLIFLTPPPSEILYGLGSTLSVISSEASNTIVNAIGIPSMISSEYGNPTIIITTPDKTTIGFTVDIACSGIYSLIGFLIFAVFIAYITRDKAWKKAPIFLTGLPLIYLLNIVRITIIILVGYKYGEQLALQIFHLMGGWVLIFLGTLLLLAITEKLFKIKTFTRSQELHMCQKCNPTPPNSQENFCRNCGRLLKYAQVKLRKKDMAKIVTLAVAVILLLSIQAPVFALTEGPAQVIIQTPTGEKGNTQILPQIAGYTLQFIYRDKNFEQKAKQDASLVYAYMPINKTKEPIWTAIEIASTTSSLHRWEVCLITWPQTHGYQPKVTQLAVKDTQILQNPPIIARYFAFRYTNTNQTQLVLYWYETSEFKTNSTAQQKHVKISLITYPDTPQEMTEAEHQLLTFATTIANHWQPIKTWTQIALTISQNGRFLAAATATLLSITLTFHLLETRKEKKSTLRLYNKLSKQDKLIIQATNQASKQDNPTTNEIATQLQKLTGKPTETATLVATLIKMQQAGLIKQDIVNQNDKPKLIWKNTLHQ